MDLISVGDTEDGCASDSQAAAWGRREIHTWSIA